MNVDFMALFTEIVILDTHVCAFKQFPIVFKKEFKGISVLKIILKLFGVF